MRLRKHLNAYFLVAVCWSGLGVGVGLLVADDRLPAEQIPESGGQEPAFAVLSIVQNNLSVVFAELGGAFLLGAPTAVALLYSGVPLGILVTRGVPVHLLLPHMVLEFLSMWLAGSVGFHVPHATIQYLREKREQILTGEEARRLLESGAGAILLMLLAGVVEVHLTPRIADLVQ